MQEKSSNSFTKTISLIFLTFIITNSHQTQLSVIGHPCDLYMADNDLFYAIKNIDIPHETFSANLSTTHFGSEGQVTFNICQSPINIPSACLKSSNSFGYVTSESTKTQSESCGQLSQFEKNSSSSNTIWNLSLLTNLGYSQNPNLPTTNYQIIKKSDEQVDHGLTIFADNSQNEIGYNIRLNLKCDSQASTAQNIHANYNESQRLYTIDLSHQNACGFPIRSFFDNLGYFKYAIGGLGILAGLLLVFFGQTLYKSS